MWVLSEYAGTPSRAARCACHHRSVLRRSGLLRSSRQPEPGFERLPLGDQVASLNGTLGRSVADEELLRVAFDQLQHSYYKPVDPQTLIKGERNGLLSYLKGALAKKNVRPALPAAAAATDETQAITALDQQLSYARAHYAPLGASAGLTEAALTGMLKSLGDPYTEYLSPQQIAALNEQLNGGDFGGIGVFIYQLKNGQVVLQPIPDLPAARSGMHAGEVVETINGHSIKALPARTRRAYDSRTRGHSGYAQDSPV